MIIIFEQTYSYLDCSCSDLTIKLSNSILSRYSLKEGDSGKQQHNLRSSSGRFNGTTAMLIWMQRNRMRSMCKSILGYSQQLIYLNILIFICPISKPHSTCCLIDKLINVILGPVYRKSDVRLFKLWGYLFRLLSLDKIS